MARNIVSGFLSVFSSRIAVLFITFLSTPVITRTLGTSGYGDFQTVTAIFSMLMIFVSSGISAGVQKFTGQRSTTDWRSNVISFYLWAAIAVAAVVGVSLLAFTLLGFIDVFVGNSGFEVYFYLLTVLVLAAQLREYTRRTLMGLDLEHYSEPLVVANTLAWVVVGLGLVYFWASNTTEQVMSLLIGQIFAGFAVTAIGFPIILRRIDVSRLFSRTPSNYPVREFLSFNVMTIVLLFLVTSLYKVDIVLIRSFIGSSRAGVYSAALALAEYLWFIPTSLQILFVHSTSDLWERRRISIINDMASRATRYTALVVILMALGIAALATHFVPLYYGNDYIEAVQPLYVLLPGAVAFAIARPMFSIGQGNGNLRPLILATGVASGLNLVLNLLLIPRFGILGAAFSTSLGYGSMLAMHTWSARHIGFNPIGDLRAGRIAGTAALSAVPIFGLAELIRSPITALIVVPIVGAIVYTLIATATGALDIDEILEIFASFPEPIGSRAADLRREISGQNLLDTNMMSKLLTGAGILLLIVGLVLSVGTLFSGQDGGPDVVANGTPTDTQIPNTNTPAAGGDGASPSDDGNGVTAAPDESSERTGTETPPLDTETPAGTPTQSPTATTETPSDGDDAPGIGAPVTATPNDTQAPGEGQGPNVETGTPAGPGDSPTTEGSNTDTDTDTDGGGPIIDLPGGDDGGDGGGTSTGAAGDTDTDTVSGDEPSAQPPGDTPEPASDTPRTTPNETPTSGGEREPNATTGTPAGPGDSPTTEGSDTDTDTDTDTDGGGPIIDLPGGDDSDDGPIIDLPGGDDDDGTATDAAGGNGDESSTEPPNDTAEPQVTANESTAGPTTGGPTETAIDGGTGTSADAGSNATNASTDARSNTVSPAPTATTFSASPPATETTESATERASTTTETNATSGDGELTPLLGQIRRGTA